MSRGKAKATLILEAAIHEIVDERAPITVRGVAYPLFSNYGLIPDMGRNSTNKVSKVMTRMREAGGLDWRKIVDDSRRVRRAPSWADPDQLIEIMVDQYRRDYWQDQPMIVEVWAEKATVQGVLQPVLDEFGVPFRVMKGYGSFTAIKNAVEASQRACRQKKGFIALYCGDWDPSGMHMSEYDIPRRFSEYGGGESPLRRIAITEEDHSCPSFDAFDKAKDMRFDWFTSRYGYKCWELDAMNPNDLRARVSEQIEACIDLPKWERAVEVEQAEVESMQDFHANWKELMGGAA